MSAASMDLNPRNYKAGGVSKAGARGRGGRRMGAGRGAGRGRGGRSMDGGRGEFLLVMPRQPVNPQKQRVSGSLV